MEHHRLDYSAANCSIARTLELVGEKWTLLVLREAFYGLRRFEDFQSTIGCVRNVLSTRLQKLVEGGILERHPYREPGQRERYEYRLTAKGLELLPVLIALMQWGDRWTADPSGPAVEVRHRECDSEVGVKLTCDAGHTGLSARDTYVSPGPGALAAA